MYTIYSIVAFVILEIINLLYCILFPFHKVEESFLLHATYDLIYEVDINKFENHLSPDLVQRSFIGPCAIVYMFYPLISVIKMLIKTNFPMQIMIRFFLGTLTNISLIKISSAFNNKNDKKFHCLYLFITIIQFHYMYYSNRTLPNTFATIIGNLAIASLLSKKYQEFIWLSTFIGCVFRFDFGVFFVILSSILLIKQKFSLKFFLFNFIPAFIFNTSFTVLVDSFFYRKIIWPELTVFYFNVVENKSSNYGVSPFYWYFIVGLFKSMGFLYIASFIYAIYSCKLFKSSLYLSATIFILTMSLLPHKEIRFLFFLIPFLNKYACQCLIKIGKSSLMNKLLVTGILSTNIILTVTQLKASYSNYPGGPAVLELNQLIDPTMNAHIHIGNFAAQNGVSKYLYNNINNWKFYKTEHLKQNDQEWGMFTHRIIDGKCAHNTYTINLKNNQTIEVNPVKSFLGFSKINLSKKSPFIDFVRDEKLCFEAINTLK